MIQSNKYNGWTNYETWNVALWLDNDGISLSEIAADSDDIYIQAKLLKNIWMPQIP